MDRCSAAVVLAVDLGSVTQQQADAAQPRGQHAASFAARSAHRQLQGRVPRGRDGAVDICSAGDERSRHLLIQQTCSHVKRRPAGLISNVDLGTVPG